jgi:hypothetical protein
MMRGALWLSLGLAVACDDAGPGAADAAPTIDGAPSVDASISLRGARYCEVLPVFLDGEDVQIQVWGTQGLNDCPAADWTSLDPAALPA